MTSFEIRISTQWRTVRERESERRGGGVRGKREERRAHYLSSPFQFWILENFRIPRHLDNTYLQYYYIRLAFLFFPFLFSAVQVSIWMPSDTEIFIYLFWFGYPLWCSVCINESHHPGFIQMFYALFIWYSIIIDCVIDCSWFWWSIIDFTVELRTQFFSSRKTRQKICKFSQWELRPCRIICMSFVKFHRYEPYWYNLFSLSLLFSLDYDLLRRIVVIDRI